MPKFSIPNPTIFPQEIPEKPQKDPKNNPNKNKIVIKATENIWKSLEQNKNKIFKFAVVKDELKPIVSLSWELNYKSVINWMRKHMEAYPEIRDGFLVKFIDDNGFKWYEVIPCEKNEEWEKFGWRKYKIIPHIYEEEMPKNKDGKIGSKNK